MTRIPVAQVVENTVRDTAWWQRTAEVIVQVGVVAAAVTAIVGAILALARLAHWLEEIRFVGRVIRPVRWVFRTVFVRPVSWLWRTRVKEPTRRFIRTEVAHAIEPPVAELRAQILETQTRVVASEQRTLGELRAHTDDERKIIGEVVRAVVAAGAARRSDLDHLRRHDDPEDFEVVRGEIPG